MADDTGLPALSRILAWLPVGVPARAIVEVADAVREISFLDGTPYAWGGGDSWTMTAVRRYLRRVQGLPRRSVGMTPYWRSPNHVDADDDR